MPVHFKPQALRESRWTEHVVRFGLGGLATVLAGVVAKIAEPTTGGLFLALPAIFCASATLIEKHERRRKQERGLQGTRRGREAAALDAAGAALGSVALAVFGVCVWQLAHMSAVLSLCIACVAWLTVAVSMWWLRRFLRLTRRTGAGRHVRFARGEESADKSHG
jgi:hypothetical protein